ncbi:MAG: LptF/LptG family permease [Candidatus Omnitrophica bacterium]|nr:LptF/LptG family permease [Candidatus Omnitrophota bacterium]
MKILRTYILKELLQPIGMSLLLFTFILIVGNLVKLADLLINKGVSPLSILQMFGLLIPTLLSYTVPIAVLTGTLLAFGKLSSDREILAMRTSGVSLWAIALPVLVVGLIFSLGLIPVNDRVVPWSHFATRKLLKEIGIRNPTAFLEPGVFIREFKPYILFLYGVEGNKLYKIRIYEPREDGPTRTIVAEQGEFIPKPEEHRVIFKLYDGSADEPDPKNRSKFYKLRFKTYAMNLDLLQGESDPASLGKKPKDMEGYQLREEIEKLSREQVDPAPLQTEFHRRYAFAFSPLIFILIGLPLGITTRRAQRSVGFGISVIVFLGYYLFFILGQAFAQKGVLPPAWAMWLGNIVVGILGFALLWRAARK